MFVASFDGLGGRGKPPDPSLYKKALPKEPSNSGKSDQKGGEFTDSGKSGRSVSG